MILVSGHAQLARQDRGAHPVARLAARDVGQADHVIAGQAVADVDLDGDRVPRDTEQGGGLDGGEQATLRDVAARTQRTMLRREAARPDDGER